MKHLLHKALKRYFKEEQVGYRFFSLLLLFVTTINAYACPMALRELIEDTQKNASFISEDSALVEALNSRKAKMFAVGVGVKITYELHKRSMNKDYQKVLQKSFLFKDLELKALIKEAGKLDSQIENKIAKMNFDFELKLDEIFEHETNGYVRQGPDALRANATEFEKDFYQRKLSELSEEKQRIKWSETLEKEQTAFKSEVEKVLREEVKLSLNARMKTLEQQLNNDVVTYLTKLDTHDKNYLKQKPLYQEFENDVKKMKNLHSQINTAGEFSEITKKLTKINTTFDNLVLNKFRTLKIQFALKYGFNRSSSVIGKGAKVLGKVMPTATFLLILRDIINEYQLSESSSSIENKYKDDELSLFLSDLSNEAICQYLLDNKNSVEHLKEVNAEFVEAITINSAVGSSIVDQREEKSTDNQSLKTIFGAKGI